MALTDDLGTFIRTVCDHNATVIPLAVETIVATGRAGGLVRPAGAGHSLAAVLETFFRAGGLAFVRPIWDDNVFPLRGARAATVAERKPGLGRDVALASGIEAVDTVIVFSNSGVNPFPVEVAEQASEAGATVIAVTSHAASDAAPPRSGIRLYEIADIVLDTLVPPGDVSWPAAAPVTAPLSSLATNALWTQVLRGIGTAAPDLPMWRSANVAGNDAFNREYEVRFGALVPEL